MLPTKAALIASLNLSIIHWSLSKIRHRDKSACSQLNPLQSRRSKLKTSQRKGHLLRFQSYSTPSADGSEQKLTIFFMILTIKVCNQIGCK